jgi:hypothetical protein
MEQKQVCVENPAKCLLRKNTCGFFAPMCCMRSMSGLKNRFLTQRSISGLKKHEEGAFLG